MTSNACKVVSEFDSALSFERQVTSAKDLNKDCAYLSLRVDAGNICYSCNVGKGREYKELSALITLEDA